MANYQSRHTGQEIDKSADQSGIFYTVEGNSVAAVTSGASSSINRTQWRCTCKKGTVNLINANSDLYSGLTIAFKVPASALADKVRGTTLKVGSSTEHPVVTGNNENPGTEFKANSIILLTYDADHTQNVTINGTETNTLGSGVWRIINAAVPIALSQLTNDGNYLTSASTLNAAKVSGTLPTSTYTDSITTVAAAANGAVSVTENTKPVTKSTDGSYTLDLNTLHTTVPGAKGPTANVNGANGNTIKIPKITIDKYGRVTALTEYTYTSVDTIYESLKNPYSLTLKVGSQPGTPVEGTNYYAYNGAAAKSLAIEAGTGVTITAAAGKATIGLSTNVNNGTLTLGTSGTGISGSASFSANASSASTFTVTLNSSSAGNRSGNKVVLSNGNGNIDSDKFSVTSSGTSKYYFNWDATNSVPQVSVTTKFKNLNADYLDGYHSDHFVAVDTEQTITGKKTFNDIDSAIIGNISVTGTANFANTINGSISGNAATATKVNTAITFNNGGSGASSGTTFDGSAARTISYNTIGAAASGHKHTTSLAADSGTATITLGYGNTYKLTAGENSVIFKMPASDDSWRPLGTGATDAAAGDHTHTTSLAADTGTATVNLSYGEKYKLSAGGTDVIFTMPASDNTDTKNTAGSSNVVSKIFLIGAPTQGTNPKTYSNSEVYVVNGVLTTNAVRVGGTKATMQYNTTNDCIEFIFA